MIHAEDGGRTVRSGIPGAVFNQTHLTAVIKSLRGFKQEEILFFPHGEETPWASVLTARH